MPPTRHLREFLRTCAANTALLVRETSIRTAVARILAAPAGPLASIPARACATLRTRLGRRSERALTVGCVVTLHAAFVLVLIYGVALPARTQTETSLVLVGGPPGAPTQSPTPLDLEKPQSPDVTPPAVDIATTTAINDPIPVPSGSPDVTRPAMALPDAHAFPVLPTALASHPTLAVRLVLSIARDGSVASADVAQTSGIAALDRMAIAWVKANWRYQPALRNGVAVAVTSLAVVTFVGP